MAFLDSLTGWHWLLLGGALLLGQFCNVGRPLLGVAAGAVLVAMVMSIRPLEGTLQLLFFIAFAVLGTAIYWRFFRIIPAKNATVKLAKYRARLLGTRASLLTPIKDGRGTVQVRDALWPVTCGQDLPAGTVVEVTGYDNQMLHVSKINGGAVFRG